MPAFRSVVSVLSRELGDFLYLLKAGPAGGRLRRPSSAGSTTTAAGDPTSPRTYPAVSLRRGLVSLTDAGFWSARLVIEEPLDQAPQHHRHREVIGLAPLLEPLVLLDREASRHRLPRPPGS